MTVIDKRTGEIAIQLSQEDARKLTDRIKLLAVSVQESVDKLGRLITQAYEQRAWGVLGYDTWADYVTAEFGTDRLRLDRDEREQVVVQLRSAGMSTRAIGSALGIHKDTVRNDIEASGESSPDDQPDTVTSLDGRQRPATQPKRPDPEPEIVDAELVDDEPEQDSPPNREPRTRIDVVRVINQAIVAAEQAAEHATRIDNHHLANRNEESAVWGRRLSAALEQLERLNTSLQEASSS